MVRLGLISGLSLINLKTGHAVLRSITYFRLHLCYWVHPAMILLYGLHYENIGPILDDVSSSSHLGKVICVSTYYERMSVPCLVEIG